MNKPLLADESNTLAECQDLMSLKTAEDDVKDDQHKMTDAKVEGQLLEYSINNENNNNHNGMWAIEYKKNLIQSEPLQIRMRDEKNSQENLTPLKRFISPLQKDHLSRETWENTVQSEESAEKTSWRSQYKNRSTTKTFPLIQHKLFNSFSFPLSVPMVVETHINSVSAEKERRLPSLHVAKEQTINASPLCAEKLRSLENTINLLREQNLEQSTGSVILRKFPLRFGANELRLHKKRYLFPSTTILTPNATKTTTTTTTNMSIQNYYIFHDRKNQVQRYDKEAFDEREHNVGRDFQINFNCSFLQEHAKQNELQQQQHQRQPKQHIMDEKSPHEIDETHNSASIGEAYEETKSAKREQQHIIINNNLDDPNEQAISNYGPPTTTPKSEHSEQLEDLLDASTRTSVYLGDHSIMNVDRVISRIPKTPETPEVCSDGYSSSSKDDVAPRLHGVTARVQLRQSQDSRVKFGSTLPSKTDAPERKEQFQPEVGAESSELVNESGIEYFKNTRTRSGANARKRQASEKLKAEIDDVVGVGLGNVSEIVKSEHFTGESSVKTATVVSSTCVKDICGKAVPEMKFEMKGFKSGLPETEGLRRRGQFKNEQSAETLTAVPRSTLSADSKYGRSAILPATVTEIGRSVSVDGPADSVLPVRTRLRRQRRTNSEDQPEDPIERLNRLRARITGALSEVKGVLKQYSTEAEADEGAADGTQPKQTENKEPVHFRFVKIVRRRSIFNEEDEEGTEKPKMEDETTKDQKEFEDQDKRKEENKVKSENENQEISRREEDKSSEKSAKEDKSVPKVGKDKATISLTTEAERENEFKDGEKEKVKLVVKERNNLVEGERNLRQLSTEKHLTEAGQKLESAEAERAQSDEKNCASQPIEIISVKENKALTKAETELKMPSLEKHAIKISTEKRAENTKSLKVEANLEERNKVPDIKATTPHLKLKKKVAAKAAVVDRRSSIAAVEGSKIQPPLPATAPTSLHSQRRPSDSEAIVKKKKFSVKNTANNEAVALTKKIAQVKRPSVKRPSADVTAASESSDAPEVTVKPAPAKANAQRDDKDTRTNLSGKDSATAATLAMPSVMDEPSVSVAKAKTTTADSGMAKKLDNKSAAAESGRPPVLSSALRASKPNGQADTATEQLAKLLGESSLIIRSTESSAASAEPKSAGSDSRPSAVNRGHAGVSQCIHDQIVADCHQTIKEVKVEQAAASAVSESRSNVPINHNEIEEIVAEDQLQQRADFTTEQQVLDVTVALSKTQVQSLSKSAANATTLTIADELLGLEATKATATAPAADSPEETSTSVASDTAAMPELPAIKVVQVFAEPNVPEPFNVPQEEFGKKKSFIRNLVRRSCTEKAQTHRKSATSGKAVMTQKAKSDKSKNGEAGVVISEDKVPPSPTLPQAESQLLPEGAAELRATAEVLSNEETFETAAEVSGETPERPAVEKKKRLLKKKVIIKRQQRKLSISDNFFKASAADESAPFAEDTVEKPVEYIKIASDEEQDYEEIVKPVRPTKSCLKVREFEVGELVMYAERYRKTQVRWKKGKVLERITSISYKLEVEGNEVSAHISYIKKYTGRKVNFGDKEYLDIEYQQVAGGEESEEEEEDEKAVAEEGGDKAKKVRSYSIWNMV